jgi:hypothetical protein
VPPLEESQVGCKGFNPEEGGVPTPGKQRMNEWMIFYRHPLFAFIELGLPRKKEFGILFFQGDEFDLVVFLQLPIKEGGVVRNPSPEGVGQADECDLHTDPAYRITVFSLWDPRGKTHSME